MTELLANRYRLGAPIASVGTGTFYEATDVRLHRPVSVKLLDTKGDDQDIDRLVREARVLGGSAEPGLVQVYDVDVRPPTPYLVTEPLVGQTLVDALATEGRPKFAAAHRWILSLGTAVAAAHQLGFVHAAIRPEAIFLLDGEDDRQAKLLGFGSARTAGSKISDSHGAIERVLPYMAPELLDGGRADPRADVYALGAVAYELLTGRPPRRPDQVAARTAVPPPSSLRSDLPPGIDVLLAKALADNPERRIQTMGHFVSGWRQISERSLVSELPSPLPIGSRIGRSYEIRGRLGRGSFGTVLLAHDELLDRHVAIKLLHQLDPRVRDRFLAEARAMAAIDHPNVVRVYALGEHNSIPYLVMEHIAGPTVEELLLEQGRLPLADAVSILQQTARGLHAVHSAGLTHADVKPGNVLIGPAFRVCVSDFGLARAHGELRAKKGLTGTPAYMAPEIIEGRVERGLEHRVDVYALGVMAFELLTGRLPFLETSSQALMHAHRLREPPAPSEVFPSMPEVFDRVVLNALAKDPRVRTPSADAFRAGLDEAARRVEAGRSQARVLLVDDDPHFRELVALHLEADFPGVSIDPVGAAAEALKALETRRYDLVLLDLDLPDMNAVEVAATVRSDFDNPPPLVVVTGTGGAADWQILSSLGVRAFLLKPINRDALSVTVRRFLE